MMFAERLKKLRFDRNITQAKFAKKVGVAQQTVGSWESGNSKPNYEILDKIADYFDVSADYLIGRKNADKNNFLSDDQKHLLNDFDSLTVDGKNAVWLILNSLRITHSVNNISKTTGSANLVQNNNNGNNIYANGGGNSYNFATAR